MPIELELDSLQGLVVFGKTGPRTPDTVEKRSPQFAGDWSVASARRGGIDSNVSWARISNGRRHLLCSMNDEGANTKPEIPLERMAPGRLDGLQNFL